ncbi:hypothetical protein ACF06X_06220 [Streptomyces sp. NPDC015346]|uniref:hypothetical protein n=1 Tax=Streptomyces sp. NPDC015346 TaxID=3364954 RepID=UPI0036FD895D
MTERYVPKFSHKDWIDHQHRVQAGGEEGLNSRFHQLEDEFAGLARNQINPIIEALGVSTRHLTLVPVLNRYTENGSERPPWLQAVDMVEKPNLAEEAHGFMNVTLPDGVIVKSLLVTGSNLSSTGTLTVALKSREINNREDTDVLLTSKTLGTPARPEGGEVKISNKTHRYYLTVQVERADPEEAVTVFCVQITYE